ncbi:hypothetical protein [Alteromonas sp. a30]|uniref:hypothetical protein n=1 Tax=Alteromonas sp. a30 TaxID=2730917 RepID=UPI00227FDB9F|nr:hypothetical protein [Alteromonas sp. a30]MCY7296831.1 hypothetical protein [Alteromonas sp. a30]
MKTVKEIEETGRQFFMAGLGIVGLSKDYAVHKLDNFMEGVNEFVNELLIRGEAVEQDLEKKDKLQLVKEKRIAQIRQRLGLANDPYTSELDALSHKLDDLSRVIDKLIQKKAEEKAAKETSTTAGKSAEKADTKEDKPVAKTTARKRTSSAASKRTSSTKSTASSSATKSAERDTKSTTAKTASKPATRRTTQSKTTQTKSSSTNASASQNKTDSE